MELAAARGASRDARRSDIARTTSSRRERVMVAVALIVCIVAVLVSAAIVWLSLTDPVAVAQMIDGRTVGSLVRVVATVLVTAAVRVVRLL